MRSVGLTFRPTRMRTYVRVDVEPEGRAGGDRRSPPPRSSSGVPVLRPVQEHGRYDLAFEIGERIYRVQCKWGALDRASRGRSRRTPYLLPDVPGSASDRLHRRRDRSRGRVLRRQRSLLPAPEQPDRRANARSGFASRHPVTGSGRALTLPRITSSRGCSSAGRASRWQREGQGFEPPQLHSLTGVADRLPRVPQPLRPLPRAGRRRPRDRDQPPRAALRPPRSRSAMSRATD